MHLHLSVTLGSKLDGKIVAGPDPDLTTLVLVLNRETHHQAIATSFDLIVTEPHPPHNRKLYKRPSSAIRSSPLPPSSSHSIQKQLSRFSSIYITTKTFSASLGTSATRAALPSFLSDFRTLSRFQ